MPPKPSVALVPPQHTHPTAPTAPAAAPHPPLVRAGGSAGARLTRAGRALLRELEAEFTRDTPGNNVRWWGLLQQVRREDGDVGGNAGGDVA